MKICLEKAQENGPAGRKKGKTERVTGLGRKTREETVKWNQMTALRVPDRGRHPTSPASLSSIEKREYFIQFFYAKYSLFSRQ